MRTTEDGQPLKLPAFEPIGRGQRLSDRVADELLAMLIAHDLPSGSKLPSERELGEQFGVSRTVIREATRALVAQGVLDVRAGAGLTVAAADASSVTSSMGHYLRGGGIPYEMVHEVRSMIEVEIAGRAATRWIDGEAGILIAINERLAKLDPVIENEAYSITDVEFHRQIARMTHNDLYLVMLDAIGNVLLNVRRATFAVPDSRLLAIRAHRSIGERIAAHDVAGAQEAMRLHLDQSIETWQRLDRPVS